MECIYLTDVKKGDREFVRVTILKAGEMRSWDKTYPSDLPFAQVQALLELKESLNRDEKQYFYFESEELAKRIEREYEQRLSCSLSNVSYPKTECIDLFCNWLMHRKWKPVFCFNGALNHRLHKKLEETLRGVAMTEKEIAKAIAEIDLYEPKYYRMYSQNPSAGIIQCRVNELLTTDDGMDASDTIMAFMMYPAIKWSLRGKDTDTLIARVACADEIGEKIVRLKQTQKIIRTAIGFTPALLLERRKMYFEAAEKLANTVENIVESITDYPYNGKTYHDILCAFIGQNNKKISKYILDKNFPDLIKLVHEEWGDNLTAAIDGIMKPYILQEESDDKSQFYHNVHQLLIEYNKILWQAQRSRDKSMKLLVCDNEEEMLSITQSDNKLSQGYLIVEFAKIIHGGIEMIKEFPKKGESYYSILKELTSLSSANMAEKDMAVKLGMSSFAFSTKKREALDALASILWGCDGTLFYDMLTKPKA